MASPEDLDALDELKYTRAVIRVAAASLSPDAQLAFVKAFDTLNSRQVTRMLTAQRPSSEEDIKRASGGVWSAAKDFVSEYLGGAPSPAKVEELAERIAGRQLNSAQIDAIRGALASKGAEATLSWLTQLVTRVAGGNDVVALPAGSTLVP